MGQGELKSREPAEATRKANLARNGAAGDVMDSLAGDDEGHAERRPTSFARFLRDVLIIAVLLGGGMYAYRKHVVTKEQVGVLATQAVEKMEKDDLESLREAERLYKQILDLDGDNDRGLVGLAETYFHESQHGLPTRDQAEQYVKRAAAENSRRPERFATQAYLQISGGNAPAAEREIKELLDKGIASSKLAHAWGWSLLEQGDYVKANQMVRTALDTDFNAVRFALTLAEIAHRQGEERAAIRQLRNATQSSMNPKHEIALAWLAALSAKNYGNVTAPAKAIQDVQEKKDKIGPRALALLAWAEGELALALGNADGKDGALEKAEDALSKQKDFPPFLDLKARALLATKKTKEALEVYEQAAQARPEYRGIKRDLIELKSERKDDGALALIDEIQKSHSGAPGPEFEIMRGEHYLRKGDLEQAKAAFTRAADLGDDPAILFGLARVTFEEEKKKDSKADLERVAEAFQSTLDRRATYPEVHEYMAQISLWNFQVDGANGSFVEAETQYKKLNRSIPEMMKFFERVIATFDGVNDKRVKKDTDKAVADWKKRKEQYVATVLTQESE